jgi:hypothetical protein
MHIYKVLFAFLLAFLCLNGHAAAKKNGNKPNKGTGSGKKGPYGIVPTKKSLNNKACRATWICGESKCLGVDDQWLNSCNEDKECDQDLKSWVLTAAKSQWGNTATHYKAVNNIQKAANCKKFVAENPVLVKDIKSCMNSFGQSGSNYKVKYNDICEIISRVCTVSDYGVKTVGFPQRTMVISVADQSKCKESGVNSCRSHHRALCVNGKVYDGYISTKQH